MVLLPNAKADTEPRFYNSGDEHGDEGKSLLPKGIHVNKSKKVTYKSINAAARPRDPADVLRDERARYTAQSTQKARRRCLVVEPVIILYFMSFAPGTPLLQQYIYSAIAERDFNVSWSMIKAAANSSHCQDRANDSYNAIEQQVNARAARLLMIMNTVGVVPALFSCLLFGAYSDSGGRTVAIKLPLVGGMLRAGICALVVGLRLPMELVAAGLLCETFLGGIPTMLTSCFAYIADITTTENRSIRLVCLEVCVAIGTVIAQFGMGYFISFLGFFWPFVLIGCMHLLNLVYVCCFVPESVEPHPEARFFTCENFSKTARLYFVDERCSKRWKYLVCLLLIFLTSTVSLARADSQVFYQLGAPLCWNSVLVGFYNGAQFLTMNLGSVTLTKLCQKRFGDRGLLLVGYLSGIAYQLWFANSTTTKMMFLSPLFGIFSLLMVSMIRSILSKTVESHQIGAAFSGIAWMQQFSLITGTIAFNFTYSLTLQVFKTFVFYIMAGVYGLGALVTILFTVAIYLERVRQRRRSGLMSCVHRISSMSQENCCAACPDCNCLVFT